MRSGIDFECGIDLVPVNLDSQRQLCFLLCARDIFIIKRATRRRDL